MDETMPRPEQSFDRRVFKRWSIAIPAGMDETFVEDEGYWHAWDERPSISLTPHRILKQAPPLHGEALPALNELAGWARSVETPDSEKAANAVSGILVVDGNVLIITVTSDDIGWARRTWRSLQTRGSAT